MAQSSLLTPGTSADDAVSADSAVTRESLGSFILAGIARCSGPQLPNYRAEEILDGFWQRYGPAGMAICERAFGAHNGIWHGAPITVLRFQESHDSFFAGPLLREARTDQETGTNL